MTPPTACIVVFEKRPFWGPELQRQLVTRRVLVRECRAVNDLTLATNDFASALIVLDLDSAPVDCLSWLSQQSRALRPRPVIACASTDLSELEWTVREAGVIAFVRDDAAGRELARLCLRQLRLA